MSGLALWPLAPTAAALIVHRAETGTTCSRVAGGEGPKSLPGRDCSPQDGCMTEPITVGYDGSESSSEAVRWAAQEAVARTAPLHVVACWDDMASLAAGAAAFPEAGAVLSSRNAMETVLERMVGIVERSLPDLKVTAETQPGPASAVLMDRASIDGLLVVGASGHHGAGAFWLGSTARHLVRHAVCPVAVVRGAASRGRPDRIVVGVDGSATSDRALRWASDEADLHHVELSVVHGWWYPYEARTNAAEQARDLTQIDAAGVLEEAERLARDRCTAEVTGQLVEGSPPAAVLDSVRDGDLLVMGSRGRGAVRSGLFGSTVYNVLDHSAVPVVVVRGVEDRDPA